MAAGFRQTFVLAMDIYYISKKFPEDDFYALANCPDKEIFKI